MRTVIGYHRLRGLVPYRVGVRLQEQLVQRRIADPSVPNVLLMLEHSPVYTGGRRLKGDAFVIEAARIKLDYVTYILLNLLVATETGLELFETARGGQTTFHGPQQLVGYPVVDLRTIETRLPSATANNPNKNAHSISVRAFVGSVEDALIVACGRLGVNTKKTKDTGVWVTDDRKVAALGIQVSRYITSHGFALNCDVDLKYYDAIVPCGLSDKQATSLTRELELLLLKPTQETGQPKSNQVKVRVTAEDAIPAVCFGLEQVFNVQMIQLSSVDERLASEIDNFVEQNKPTTE
ncbi:hypothetical protein BC830DRAFT_1166313 [Chytriomyces sp. MP71]|nr:hypothetical protein BC830DRAFT_1166313 [Chytriomyces sp. MP71]